MENLLKKIEELRERLIKNKALLDLPALESELLEKKRLMSAPDFWQDQKTAVEISKRAEFLEKELSLWSGLQSEITELEQLVALSQEEGDMSWVDDGEKRLVDLAKKFDDLEFSLLFAGSYDDHNAIISLHAGVGGVDAQDFAEILERMYLRFAEQRGFKAEVLDRSEGTEAGIKSSTIKISGDFAYGYLKSENGVHRLGRISPFDAEAMRQTSFVLVEVVPELNNNDEIEVKDDDIEMSFFHSSGPGGQNVNKTSSAVRIVHKPSGIVVACQSQRSQHQNRENAISILKAKLLALAEKEKEAAEKKMHGHVKSAEWGQQIRSYILYGSRLVKDHRTGEESSDTDGVFAGNILSFIEAYLRDLKKDQGH